jgi:hypothetical protein
MEVTSQTIAPGARIIVSDAEWLVRRIDLTKTDIQALIQVIAVFAGERAQRFQMLHYLGSDIYLPRK